MTCAFSKHSHAQTINIDSTFTSSGEIYPFNQNDTIYSLGVSGNVVLNSDTSLIRVIFIDDDYNEYLLYEAYPYISSRWNFSIANVSDETKYLNTTQPHSLYIYIHDGSFELASLHYTSDPIDFADSLQLIYKQVVEEQKISSINSNIEQRDMVWYADETSVSQLPYSEKKKIFGKDYNLHGFDYYSAGIYDFSFGIISIPTTSSLVPDFDWRNRHNANEDIIPNSPYYDNFLGWMTPVDKQNCNHCWIFAPVHATEALVNLYFNQQINVDLSEQAVASCKTPWDECYGGIISNTFNYIKDTGIVNEICFPYNYLDPAGSNNPCELCASPDEVIQIENAQTFNDATLDEIRINIITKGPVVMNIKEWWHSMVFCGYGQIKYLDEIFLLNNSDSSITISNPNNPLIGRNYWIVKNSWEQGWGESGFGRILCPISEFKARQYIEIPITSLVNNYNISCLDVDKDGYYNWGISEDTSSCPPYPDDRDSNDGDSRIGPYDKNFYGTPVRPIMELSCDNENIDDDGFFTFYETAQNRDFVFTITNDGSALLNLDQFSTITSSNTTLFEVIIDTSFTPGIGMEGGTTQFTVRYYYTPESSFDKSVITIHTLEPEYGDFEFVIANVNCNQLPGGDINITSSTTWDSQDIISGNVYVHNGAELTIEGIIGFIDGVDLNIKPGGRVIIDGGVLTNVCDNSWQGVDVWGDANLCQYPISNQGFLNIINGGKIQNAEYGIQVANAINLTSYAKGTTGGIVKCDSAIFINNKYDVIIYPYRNINPGTGEEVPNMCTFRNSFFITDFGYYESEKHVYLRGVDGVKFRGCTFENKTNFVDTPFNEKLDVGIYSHNSGFYVEDYCMNYSVPCNHSNRCLFNNLRYGVYALNSMSSKYICIDTAIFLNNLTGIYMSAVDEQRITSNDLLIDYFEDFSVAYDAPKPVGLYLEACKYYMVEENSFSNESTIDNTIGIHILNSGPYINEIYNNSFSDFYTGIMAVGENRDEQGAGLCLLCNDFRNCVTDNGVSVELDDQGYPITGPTIGIASMQQIYYQNYEDPAGNSFTESPSGDNYNNHTDCGHIDYIHHDDYDPPRKIKPEPYSLNISLIEDVGNLYTKETACPSNLANPTDVQTEMSTLSLESVQIFAYEDTLSQFVDGGDTEVLIFEVQTSLPNEALQVRQELLNESPYLSDTVMETAIVKENVLPNAMIRDILVANPQSAKSAKVLNTLDDRFTPMPDYMMAEIMQGQYIYGAKEILEQELAKHRSLKEKSLGKLLRYFRSDTITPLSAADRIISLLVNEPQVLSKYQLALFHLSMNDSLNAFNVLYDIPNSYILNSREQIQQDLYEELMEAIWQIDPDTNGIDSILIVELFSIAEYNRLLPGIYARNLLKDEGLLSYNEPVYYPEYLKAFPNSDNTNIGSSAEEKMKLFPNPADNYFIIEYDIREYYENAGISIINMRGNILDIFYIDDQQNQKVIPTENLPSGVYIVILTIEKHTVASKKIIIYK